MNGYVRHGMGAVRPYLYGNSAVARFIAEVFEAEELERLESRGGFHIEARIGDSTLVLETRENWPATLVRQSTYVYVPDVDAAFAKAVALGAEVVTVPENKPYHERACGLKDGFGNTWYVATFRGGTTPES
jgi:PhnB protein